MSSDGSLNSANNTSTTVITDNKAVRTVFSRRTLLRLNTMEKEIALDIFIKNYIAAEHGSEARGACEGILHTMCDNDSVRGSTKSALSTSSLEKYRKSFRQPIEDTLKRDRPSEVNDSKGIKIGEDCRRVVDENELDMLEKRTLVMKMFWMDLVAFKKDVAEQYDTTVQNVAVSLVINESSRNLKRKKRSDVQRRFAREARKVAKQVKKNQKKSIMALRYSMEVLKSSFALQRQSSSALHAIVNTFFS